MRGLELPESSAFPGAYEKRPLTHLRYPEIDGIEQQQLNTVMGAAFLVYGLNGLRNQAEPLVLGRVSQAGDIFEKICLGPGITQNPQEGIQSRGSWVIQPLGIAICPVTRFGEGLTRRTAHQEIDFVRAGPGGLQELFRGHVVDRPTDDGPVSVPPKGGDTILVHFDRHADVKTGGFQAEIESPRTGKEAYGG